MGGNVVINGERADKIDIRKLDRNMFLSDLLDFQAAYRTKFDGRLAPSGSTAFIFDLKIGTHSLELFKPEFGDIDFQVDKNKMPELLPLQTLGKFQLIGSKMTTNTLVTLWKYYGLNVQIDFEGVEFSDGEPTEWSQFAYSASWTDALAGIKGVAHKYIYRALTGRWLDSYKINGEIKQLSWWAFSNKGLRKKLESTFDGVKVLKPHETEYITDVYTILTKLIASDIPERLPTLHAAKSYSGVLGLIERYVPKDEWEKIGDSMANLLWGPGAQQIYRESFEDQVCKQRMMIVLSSTLNIPMNRWDYLIADYYGKLQND